MPEPTDDAERERAAFLAMVSHELRGPLQTLNGYLDLVLGGAGGKLTREQRTLLRRARASGERLAVSVEDLLLLARRDAGQFTLRREPVDLAPVAVEAAEELEALAAEAGVRLEVAVPERLPLVLADPSRIAQVLRNLLANAIRFTPEGGSVTLSAEAEATGLLLRVRDTGIGIAPEEQIRVFERFYQAPAASPRGGRSGQGLGLAIVRLLVAAHGGTVELDSAPGRGSVFTVRLPYH